MALSGEGPEKKYKNEKIFENFALNPHCFAFWPPPRPPSDVGVQRLRDDVGQRVHDRVAGHHGVQNGAEGGRRNRAYHVFGCVGLHP